MKPDNDLIDIIRDDKLSKSDFFGMIPEYLSVDFINRNIAEIIDLKQIPILEEIDQIKKVNDAKFVQIRQEIDVGSINRRIDSKADKNQTEEMNENIEVKVGVLDKNQILLAHDFETF